MLYGPELLFISIIKSFLAKIYLLSMALRNPWFTHLNFQLFWSTSHRHKWTPGCYLQFPPYFLLSSILLRSGISVSYTHTAKLGFLQLKSCFVSMYGDSSSFKITFLMRQNAANFVKPYKTVISSSQFKILMCLKNTNLPGMLFLIQNHVKDKNSNANFISQRINKEINLGFLNFRKVLANAFSTRGRSSCLVQPQ